MPIGVGNQDFENLANILNGIKIDETTTIIAYSIAPMSGSIKNTEENIAGLRKQKYGLL